MTALSALLDEPLRLVDVGCREGFPPGWNDLGSNVDMLGFDPDADECGRLQSSWDGRGRARFVPVGLAAQPGRVPLHLTAVAACSSMFPPEPDIWERYPDLACVRPIGEVEIDVIDLDTWRRDEDWPPVDAMKLDVQGAELEVLCGAAATLASVRVLDLEVTFQPIYSGQALFADIDAFLRAAGFTLWRLDHLVHYRRAGEPVAPPVAGWNYHDSVATSVEIGGGQLFWGQAAYVNVDALGRRSGREALRDACAFAAMALPDLAAASLARADSGEA